MGLTKEINMKFDPQKFSPKKTLIKQAKCHYIFNNSLIVITLLFITTLLIFSSLTAQQSIPQEKEKNEPPEKTEITREIEAPIEEPITEITESPIEEKKPREETSSPGAGLRDEKKRKNYILWAILLGFIFGLTRLISKFYNFWGLGIFTNLYSWLFLGVVTVFSGISYAPIQGIKNIDFQFLGLALSPILGNIVTIFGRLTRTSRLDTGATTSVKELEDAKSKNFLLELIREAISIRMDQVVYLLARKCEWEGIKYAVVRLVDVSITTGRVARKDGEETKDFINKFKPSTNEQEDLNNKYNALHRMIQVSSFRQLKYFLEICAKEQK